MLGIEQRVEGEDWHCGQTRVRGEERHGGTHEGQRYHQGCKEDINGKFREPRLGLCFFYLFIFLNRILYLMYNLQLIFIFTAAFHTKPE